MFFSRPRVKCIQIDSEASGLLSKVLAERIPSVYTMNLKSLLFLALVTGRVTRAEVGLP